MKALLRRNGHKLGWLVLDGSTLHLQPAAVDPAYAGKPENWRHYALMLLRREAMHGNPQNEADLWRMIRREPALEEDAAPLPEGLPRPVNLNTNEGWD